MEAQQREEQTPNREGAQQAYETVTLTTVPQANLVVITPQAPIQSASGEQGEELPEEIDLITEKGTLQKQEVFYEWRPIKCNHCEMFGHGEQECKKKHMTKQVWVPTRQQNEEPEDHIQPNNQVERQSNNPEEEQGFISVPRRSAARNIMTPRNEEGISDHTPIMISFQKLETKSSFKL
ncbi:hypothetical protein Cgig2_023480 [Carnegiea gigantea]|uniref:Uncharacterized protein n=1 Tax=Carnegiea gigantea TaxID=171969 RepID=A0A9Q1Q890_9CARY|nr:hypothetical protein Cgig2_023480 [Carnegiea gigantea]